MRILRGLALTALVAVVVALGSSGGHAQGPLVQFYGIGDVPDGPGGVGSAVRDATSVGGVIYAVGASTTTSVVSPAPNLDTPIMWTSSSGPNGTLTMLPPGPSFPSGFLTGTPADSITAYAITPAATFIASQIRNNVDPTQVGTPWGRVSLPGLTNTLLGGPFGGFVALSLSDSGSVVYGQNAPTGTMRRFLRYDNGLVTAPSYATELGLDPALAWSLPIPRGTSSDGLVMVGVASVGSNAGNGHFNGTNGTAFRYVHNPVTGTGTTTAIPKLTAGGWNFPIGLSPDGNLVAVAGNSSEAPRGEIYLYNAATSAITPLGSPNTTWFPRMLGGMTADGSVVAVTFANTASGGIGQIGGLQLPTNNKYAYLKNTSGWFHLASALAAQNIDMEALGWDPTNIAITGIRTVEGVDLVFGQGRRRTVGTTNFVDAQVEGFVARFPAGYLANFAVTPTPVADTSIVGAWGIGTDPNTSTFMYVFMRDGTYYEIGPGGFERGFYTWGAGGVYRLWTRRDDDGASISAHNGKVSRVVTIAGDSMTIVDTNCPGCTATTLTRVPPLPGTILGGWVLGTPTDDNNSAVGVFTGSAAGGKYFFAQDFDGFANGDGSEMGNWTWDAGTGVLALSGITQINAGQQHAEVDNSQTAQLAADGLGLVVTDDTDVIPFKRVVNPATVTPVITNANLSGSGTEDSAFSYTVTGVNALTFGATGLPTGLSINSTTGVISGTPSVNGTFNVGISITNSLGDTDTDTLVLTFAAPPVSFHGIGDLPGGNADTTGVGSAVRDATRVNGTLYAVGSSVARTQVICTAIGSSPALNTPPNCGTPIGFPNLESPVSWTSAGGPNGTLSALPEGAVHTTAPPTNQIFAYAINSNASYIAGQAHFTANGTGTQWVRDTNTNGTLSIFSQGLSTNIPQVAFAMSDDGATLYGTRAQISARIDVVGTGAPGTTATITTPLPLPGVTTFSQPAYRGTTFDGSVMVGVASAGSLTATNGVAFRYTKSTNTIGVIPTLTGGSWNVPIAISANGTKTVVAGNSPAFPNGEIYLTDASNAITATLGSPNRALAPRILGGLTNDGAIVVTFSNFGPAPTQFTLGGRYAYINNSHGWFSLSSVLAANNIDLVAQNWDPTNMMVTGVRTIEGVDLVFGQGRRRTVGPGGYVQGALEGFVVELPAGVLANFNPTPVPPVDQEIVGTWLFGDFTNPSVVVSYLADGTFVRMNINTGTTPATVLGFERGLYTWAGDAAGGALYTTTLYDNDGTSGVSQRNGQLALTGIINGDSFTFTDTNCGTCGVAAPGVRVTGSAGSIIGSWITPYPTSAPHFEQLVLTGLAGGNKYYYLGHDAQDGDGTEVGTYTWDSISKLIVMSPTGGSPDSGTATATLTRDELGLAVVITETDNDVFTLNFTRIIAPTAVVPVITNQTLTASGAEDAAFSYTVAANNALTFSASGLPPGLSIDPNTGIISGTPAVNGTFNVSVTVTNTFGATDTKTLVLTFSPPGAGIRGIGDLAGGVVSSAVRDATRVNGVIYAVGASTVNAGNNPPDLDTPVMWSSTGGANGTLQALPYGPGISNTQNTSRTVYAITPDGAYLASQAQFASSGTGTRWVRVDRSLLGGADPSLANLDISNVAGIPVGFAGLAMSSNGSVLYGQGTNTDGTRTPRRYEAGVGVNAIDITPTGYTSGVPTPRGTSANGLVMIGAASNGAITGSSVSMGPFGYPVLGTNTTAFRYEHAPGTLNGTTTPLPKLSNAAGAWNFPIAISADGAVTVVAGNSDTYPNGEIYLTNAASSITATLGSPALALTPRMLGGRTADGAIVVTFANAATSGPGQIGGLNLPANNRLPYVNNAHGWFLLGSVLRAQGVDLEALGWAPTDMNVTGVRTVEGVDLIFGQGLRRTFNASTGGFTNGAQEGFVFELPAGALASFDEPTSLPGSDALIGAWIQPLPSLSNPGTIPVYLGDGRYVTFTQGAGAYQKGVERGRYTWAGNGGEFYLTTRVDANGLNGPQNFSAMLGWTLTVTADTFHVSNTHCTAPLGCIGIDNQRVVGTPDSLVGAWRGTLPSGPYAGTIVTSVFLPAAQGSRYFIDYDVPTGEDELDLGSWSYDAATHTVTLTPDNGSGPDPNLATLSRDGLTVLMEDVDITISLTRVVRPSAVVPTITSPLTANGGFNAPFSYQATGTYTLTFSATGLPPGLSIDANTGLISGTPTATGAFSAALTATNTFGGSTTATLSITITPGSQATLAVVGPATAVYGSSFTASTTGGSGGGGVSFTASNGCSNVSGGALITMTSGSVSCSITATKAAEGNYAQTTSAAFAVTALPATQSALTVTGAPVSAGLGASFTLSTSGGSGTGGVTFDATGICSNTAGGAVITMTSAVGSCTVTATRAADGNFASATSPAIIISGNSFGGDELPALASFLNPATDQAISTNLLAGPLLVAPFTLSNADFDVSTSTSGNFGVIQAGTSAAVHSTAAFPPRPFPSAGAKWVDYFQITGGTPGTVVQFLVTTRATASLNMSAGTANPFPADPGAVTISTTLRGLPGGQEQCAAGGGFTLCNTIGTRVLHGTYNVAGEQSLTDTTTGTLDDAFLVSLVVGQTYRVEHGVNAYSLIQGMQTLTVTSDVVGHFYLDPMTPGAGYVSASGTGYSSPGTVAQHPLVITGAPSVASTAATFTVGSTGGSGTGAVSFTAGGVCTRDIGTGTIHMTGQPGTCSIVAVKAGDATYAPAVAPAVDVTVTNAQALLVIVAPASAVYGTSFTASTTGGSGTGAVTFAASGGCTNVVGGDLITMTSGTTACSLTATKASDGSYVPITSDPWAITAIKAEQAAMLLLGAPANAIFGTSFSVSASGGSGTGAVTFAATGACSNTAGGALITMTSGTGTCNLSATKAGNANYNPSTSAGVAVTAVKAAQAALSLTNAPASAVFGSSFTVGSTGGSSTGGVTFAASNACSNVSGGSLISMVGGSGACSITATRAGDANYNPITSASASVTAVVATSSTSLGASPITSAPGQAVTFTATVTSQFGGATSGTVTFKRGNTVLGTASVVNGVATLILSNLGNGSHVVTAVYAGDSNSSGSTSSSATVTVVAPAAATTTTLATSQTPAIVGQSVTFTATVSSSTSGTITGTVTFKRAQTVLATVSLANGQAAFTTSTLPLGTSNITATYSGDAQYITSTSAGLNQVITQASTTTSLGSSPNPSNGNQLVTLTATITSGTPGAMTGTVTFKRGQTVLLTVAVSGNHASMTTATLPAGASNLTATYSGDATYVGSTSPAITHTVNTGSTTTTLTSSLNPSTFGTAVTFTATVASTLGTVPTGSVEFSEGSTVYGTGVVDAAGHATFTTSTLTLKNGKTATHNLKAKYLGNAYNTTSTSLVLPQVVNP